MGLTAWFSGFATSRPHLLLVEAAGGSAARLQVERLAREHGWRVADTPADADVLVVCGAAGGVEQHVGRLWDQLPGPRAQVRVGGAEDAQAALLDARGRLSDRALQRADVRRTERPPAAAAPMSEMDMSGHDMGGDGQPVDDPHAGHDAGGGEPPVDDPHAGHDMGGTDMSGHDIGGMDMSGHDMGGMDMSGHEGHDMGGMEMPAGLAMADRSPDRDGLQLDVLTVPWGPVLAWWPEGLVLTTVLQGDVVQSASAEQLGSGAERRAGWVAALSHLDDPVAAAVVRLDALVRLLGVAGWDGARLRCQRVRDALLAGEPAGPDLRRLSQQVSRSRALRRMTVGLPALGGQDVASWYRAELAAAVAAVEQGVVPSPVDELHVLHQLPDLVTGAEVAGMRLVVASLDLALSGADVRAGAGV